LSETIQRIQQWAEIIGPNRYLQALLIAVVFIVVGKIAKTLKIDSGRSSRRIAA